MPVDIHPEYGQSGIEIILTNYMQAENLVPIITNFLVVYMVSVFLS